MEKVRLRAENVTKHFMSNNQEKVTALQGVNLSINKGEFISLLGPSGCGKSTFLRLVAALETHDEGVLELDGKPITEAGRDRGVVFQQYSLLPWLTVWENVAFALKKGKKMKTQEMKEIAYHYVSLVGLKGFETYYPSQLSGGMQQRVAIARALVYKPGLLLMDEPFGALDAQIRREMQDLLLEVWQKEKCSVLFVTHDVDEAIYLSDRVYVMSARPGRICNEIEIDLERPRNLDMQLTDKFIEYKREILLDLQG